MDDLANQDEIEYGTLLHSAPYEVFRTATSSPYKKMYSKMKDTIKRKYDPFVSTAEEGIQMVRNSYGTKHSECNICSI